MLAKAQPRPRPAVVRDLRRQPGQPAVNQKLSDFGIREGLIDRT
jgi:hypothetical protein